MRKSLTAKLFFISLSGFLCILVLISLFQIVYFDRFYEKQKIQSLLDSFSEFCIEFETADWSDEDYINNSNTFNVENNASVYYYYNDTDDNYEFYDDSVYHKLTLKTEEDHYYDVFLYSDEDYNNAIVSNNLKVGQPVTISGYYDGMFDLVPATINTVPVNSYDIDYFAYSDYGYIEITDEYILADIQSYDLNEYYNNLTIVYDDDYDNSLYNTIDVSSLNTLGEEYQDGDITYIITTYPDTNLKQVDFYKEIFINDESISLLANASLQSVNEVMEFNVQNFPYFIFIAFILSIIIALLYSRHVSRPIVQLTAVADEMTEMNFNVLSNINRSDEIGRLSDSLNILASELESSVGQLQVANEHLKADYDEISLQEKIRKEFVANVSHELKTPLGIIKSFSEGIKDGIRKDKKDYYVDVILDESQKMEHLIIELLELSKLDAGKITFELTDFSPEDIIKDCLIGYSPKFIEKDLNISSVLAEGIVHSDSIKFEQILLNLLENVYKYATKATEVIIKSTIQNNRLVLTIENHCDPLSEDALVHIWDRFYKSDTSHNRTYTGSGLGLSIVKSTIDALNGTISVANTEIGVIFTITL